MNVQEISEKNTIVTKSANQQKLNLIITILFYYLKNYAI